MKRIFRAKNIKCARLRCRDKYYPGTIKVKTLKRPSKNNLGKYCVTYKLRK